MLLNGMVPTNFTAIGQHFVAIDLDYKGRTVP